MAQNIHINFTKYGSFIQLADYFSTEDICKAVIAQQRWGDGKAVYPYCGPTHTYVCSDGRYSCQNYHKKFSVTVGTIFENTKISLRKWFMAIYLISSHKKGASSCQLARDLNITQKTAWFILHKVHGLYGQSNATILDGGVEMDGMYLGGRETKKHDSKRIEGTQGRSTKTKPPVFGRVEHEGNVVAMKVENSKGATLLPIVGRFVADTARLYTDEYIAYNALDRQYYRQFVNHKQREFVRANDIHTNSIEGFWVHFNRVVFGTYHCVSQDYLQRYIDEQVYRWNTRNEKALFRFSDMFSKACKKFDYSDVLSLSLSSVVDIDMMDLKHKAYYQWYMQNRTA